MVEVARTERKLPASRLTPAGASGFWRSILRTQEDINGWSPEEKAAYAAGRFARTATAAEVSRWEEVLHWIMHTVTEERNRRAVSAWAQMKAGGRHMKARCKGEGIEEHAGKRRADRAVREIAAAFGNNPSLLISVGSEGVFIEEPVSGTENGTLDELALQAAQRSPRAWMASDAKPLAHDEDDPDAVQASAKAIEQHNKAMRRRAASIEARKREKLNVFETS
ncbi:hypothetical protein [Acuticoccus kandeliae]|uniref:hypothetical protein n=1 Tax=Acuticoccus kandeliae TaxID=2073160 RepID=UPI0013009FFD|nr:hypothetical protein [Acuticoccus kandeliae]